MSESDLDVRDDIKQLKKMEDEEQNTTKVERKSVTVVLKDPTDNPCCPHGPTLLLSKMVKDKEKKFYICAAQRDRKFCPFRMAEGGKPKSSEFWKQQAENFLKGIDHKKMFSLLNEIKLLKPAERIYCSTCVSFIKVIDSEHETHDLVTDITDDQLIHPTEILPALKNNSKEAQYWFTKSCSEDIVQILKSLDYRNFICIGAPRIHECIRKSDSNLRSVLLDFDKRFHSFFGPLEFCWYNLFNNHFLLDKGKAAFHEFLKTDNGNNMVIITDPPFGGRTEVIAFTFKQINETYRKLNNRNDDIPMFWIYPYYMEAYIRYADPNFTMLDYKVEYENHKKFSNPPKRNWGSPVRIFTTVNPSLIKLPDDGRHKYCEKCDKWVSIENEHCDICEACTSKDGKTYVHCSKCNKCVKPTYIHCETCIWCVLPEHHCTGTPFNKPCFYCDSMWHNEKNCPNRRISKRKRQAIKLKKEMAKKVKTEKASEQETGDQSGTESSCTGEGTSQQ